MAVQFARFFGACMCKESIAVPAEVWGQRELRFEQIEQIPFTSIYQLQTRAFSLDRACFLFFSK